ncbi:MAG TPA: IgGFc-binding protein [Candidatus Kapabacteria bacterium]|nr:IgGFc-binding protein [Candidatus Kapabacteria bacterium]
MKQIIILLIVCIACSVVNIAQEQINSDKYFMKMKEPVGVEFWLCFMTNYKIESQKTQNALLLELFITGDEDANVKISIGALGYNKTIFVKGGTVESVEIDPLAELRSQEVIEHGMAIHVTSDKPISVYGLNRRYQTTDTYMGLPVNVLGKEYRIMSYEVALTLSPIFAIVGVEDNTIVEIIPRTLTSTGKKANVPYEITLNKGDVFQVRAENQRVILRNNGIDNPKDVDLTGSLIKSNKNIAVFGGHECSYVPAAPPLIKACNHLVEQMPPISSWGKHFYIGKLKRRSIYTYRVLANYPNTKVFENSKQVATLQPGEYFEKNSAANIQITADRPVLVAQYSQGFDNGDKTGDPMMLLISPTQQFLKNYRFATPVNGSWFHYINVVVPNSAINTFKLDGHKVSTNSFEPLGISKYSIAYLEVPFGTHSITADEPFGMYSYGFGYGDVDAYDAYGNMGGQSFLEYTPKSDTLKPYVDLLKNDNNQTTMVLRDDRRDDTGVDAIALIDSMGIKFNIPKFSSGVLQVPIEIKPENELSEGRLVFELTDVSHNKQVFTLCYHYDLLEQKYQFDITEGIDNACMSTSQYTIGAFGKYNFNFHSSSFSKTEGLNMPGYTQDAIGSGGLLGFYFGTKLKNRFAFNSKLSLDDFGATLTAPDSLLSHIRDATNGSLIPFQEKRTIDLKSLSLNLAIGIDYTLLRNVYANFAINLSYRLTKSVNVSKSIIMPEEYIYPSNNTNTLDLNINELNALKSFNLGLSFGLGVNFPINKYINPFLEVNYQYNPFNIIENEWKINSLSFLLGFKYRI